MYVPTSYMPALCFIKQMDFGIKCVRAELFRIRGKL